MVGYLMEKPRIWSYYQNNVYYYFYSKFFFHLLNFQELNDDIIYEELDFADFELKFQVQKRDRVNSSSKSGKSKSQSMTVSSLDNFTKYQKFIFKKRNVLYRDTYIYIYFRSCKIREKIEDIE